MITTKKLGICTAGFLFSLIGMENTESHRDQHNEGFHSSSRKKLEQNQSSFSGIRKEAPLAAADPGKSSGIPAPPRYPGRNRDGVVPMRSWE